MEVDVRDDRGKAGDELDDLGQGDENLARDTATVENGGVVSVHDCMHKAVEDHAVDAEDETSVEPPPYLKGDGRMMQDV